MKKDLKKVFILAGCFVLVLTISLVGCFSGGTNTEFQCQCEEECTSECVCGCQDVAEVFAPLGERDNAVVAVIGSNAALANVGIDMTLAFFETLGKSADFNEVHDRDVLRELKAGRVDVAISFTERADDAEIMWLPLISNDEEKFYIAVRRSDTEFMNNFQDFINKYHQDGDLERLARTYMANHQDFMGDIAPPFQFSR